MTSTNTTDPAPDWASLAAELHCPLCEYNLRGLVEPRCPECGFAFTWAEILRGQRETHPYLFEHHRNRNVWSFWKTYWNDCRPRKFWKELNPAQPVRVRRLMIYWAGTVWILLAMFMTPLARNAWEVFRQPTVLTVPIPNYFLSRTHWNWIREAYSRPIDTLPTRGTYSGSGQSTWILPEYSLRHRLEDISLFTLDEMGQSLVVRNALVVLLWPWLTLIYLLIFVGSMRRAKLQKRHLIRVIVYGTDFCFFMIIPLIICSNLRQGTGWIVWLCAVLTLYRVYFAYKHYLRFHLPLATVLCSQIMVFLSLMIVYLQIYRDYW